MPAVDPHLYSFFKDTHSILRWVILLSLLATLLRMWSGVLSRSEWTKKDRISGLIFTSLLNLQLLLGLALYAISPITRGALLNFHSAMRVDTLRFFTVEHPFGMVLAIVIAQVGYSMAKRAPTDRDKFLRSAIAYTIAGLLIVISIPWPFLPYGRPLF